MRAPADLGAAAEHVCEGVGCVRGGGDQAVELGGGGVADAEAGCDQGLEVGGGGGG